MKKLILLLFLSQTFLPHASRAQDAPNPKAPASERRELVISNFKTESGVTLPKAVIIYRTYGHLNAAKDNAVLLPSHYMADSHGYEWLIGASPNLCLNPDKLFGNKKKKQQQDDNAKAGTPAPPPNPNPDPNALMEMTTQVSSFSDSLLDASLLEIPAGYAQVQANPDQMLLTPTQTRRR
jgi:homoserine O-acetyltransferase/O-succinyltransferase